MLNEVTSSRLMDDYLTECWTEPTTDLYDFVEDKYNQLIKDYGFNKIQTAIECCLPHKMSVEDEDWAIAAKKLSKREILEINTTLGLICGIAEAELHRVKANN